MATWAGVFPAVTTKFHGDESLNIEATQLSIDRLIKHGVAGVIVVPMLGENTSLTQAEKERVVSAAREVVANRVPLLAGLAEVTTEAACRNGRRFKECGAEGLMVFPSVGYRSDPHETVAWYRAIAADPGLPIMVYNNPGAYGVDVSPAVLEQLVGTSEIVCVKEESGDVRRITDLYNAFGDRFDVFCGVDDLLLECTAVGATGWVPGMANAWPRESVTIFDLCERGAFDEARALYRIMTPVFHLDAHVKLVQFVKLAEHLVYDAPEWTRKPRLPVFGAERQQVSALIERTIKAIERYFQDRADSTRTNAAATP